MANPAATPKMRQNLALVLAIQGKYAEAEQLARKDLPPEQAAANLKYWKESLGSAKPASPQPVKTAKPAAEKPAKPVKATAPAAAPEQTSAPAPAAPESFDLRS